MAPGQRRDEIGRGLEATAQHEADRSPTGTNGQVVERVDDGAHIAPPASEAAFQPTIAFGASQRILVAEQIEHERPQAGPARGLCQSAPGLRRDQNRIAAHRAFEAQPATSTATL